MDFRKGGSIVASQICAESKLALNIEHHPPLDSSRPQTSTRLRMADDARDIKSEAVDTALGEMKIEEERGSDGPHETTASNGKYEDAPTPGDIKRSRSGTPAQKSTPRSPPKNSSASQTPKSDYEEDEEVIGGDITLTVEPGKAPKLSRKSTQKVAARPALLYNDLPDSTEDSLSVFQIIPECLYGSKSMGKSKMSDDDDGPIDCDCSEHRSKCL